ncbi:C4-dicarboxylate transporter DctA [Legionella cincinnatiensis]|uniref:C4-dicarboxylic acid, orotate and citrate transporter n=1 Tax=Legionella cincinnatiensis TaxID=28085 RepID=A0A378IG21_9GAMM|nr:C4-dicarboxylate transporter DctA [Legionella cincinnatiensis]KTC82728.1 C4-dicarboxylic acid, orotate and citrate transporter [Legionella cincinnatiensis]STX34159.1 C4-dicarboxylic acid, orotate and citrate transporter [Legionella cincinnatiensis]
MKFFKRLYVQVIAGIIIGILLGIVAPTLAVSFKPFADLFIKLIKMMITPIIFLTLVSGIAAMSDLKTVGRVGGISLIYFLITTICALVLGLVVANIVQPGAGMNIDPSSLNISEAQSYLGKTEQISNVQDFVLNIVPETFFSAFVQGEILQVLFVAILFALGLMSYGSKGKFILEGFEHLTKIFFNIIHAMMHYAPVAAFAAMAYTVGQYGAHSLLGLTELLLCFYLTCIVFILVLLGSVLYFVLGLNVFKVIQYFKTEIFIVFATSSSETVMPNLLEKLTELGCDKSVVDLVIPTGYSFNLDGTAIYLTLAALFIAQATNSNLPLDQQIFLLMIMIISSKGAAGVTGSGFIILASSLAAVGTIPVAGVVIILGVDRFMSGGRSLTNMIGNAIAALIISKWQKSINMKKVREKLA